MSTWITAKLRCVRTCTKLALKFLAWYSHNVSYMNNYELTNFLGVKHWNVNYRTSLQLYCCTNLNVYHRLFPPQMFNEVRPCRYVTNYVCQKVMVLSYKYLKVLRTLNNLDEYEYISFPRYIFTCWIFNNHYSLISLQMQVLTSTKPQKTKCR